MTATQVLIICGIVSSYAIVLSLGLGLGYIFLSKSIDFNSDRPTSFLKSQGKKTPNSNTAIEIDDTKVVLNVSTDGLEKKYDNMTKETKVKSDIAGSVNKLKSMKGK